ncbi:MAG: GNAT family N-acetyltransferase [Candidatus Obscuribacterales bacterium]|nr:GNAT family N-acetyltransferase [Candidatus Obscuribacterales bacterium]
MKVVIETERTFLREMSMDDIDFVAGLLSNQKAMRYFPKLYSRKEAQQAIEKHMFRYKLQGHSVWIMEDKKLAKPVGYLGLVMQSVERKAEPEIGYILHPDYWKCGYATEGATATRDYAFETLNYPYVISLIRPINEPSQAVARRVGMKIDRKVDFFDNAHYVYKLNKADLK